MRLTWLFGASLFALSSPAFAADDVDCIVGLLSDQQTTEAYTALIENNRPSSASRAAMASAATACGDIHQWTPPQRQAALQYSLAKILHDRWLRTSPFSSEDLAKIISWFDALPDTTLERLFSEVQSDDSGAEMGSPDDFYAEMDSLVAEAGIAIGPDHFEFFGTMLAYRYLMHTARGAFRAM